MKDVEFSAIKAGEANSLDPGRDPREPYVVRRNFTPKQVLTYIGVAVIMIGAIFGIGLVASVCERSYQDRDGLHSTQDAVSQQSETGPQLAARALQMPGVLHAKDLVPDAEMTATFDEDEGVKIPISTQTELSTLYSFSRIVLPTLSPPEETECTPAVVTKTHTAVVTVTVSPLPESSGDGFVTVTGDPSTVTEDQTHLTGPTVITISGEPSTVTDVQTDTSYTSGLPNVTVSGNPATVTDVETSFSVTQGLPDATVTGDPGTVIETDVSYSLSTSASSVITVVISDLWDPLPTTTVTSFATSQVTVTTVEFSRIETFTDYPLPPTEESSSAVYTSDAKGEGQTRSHSITATVIIDPPFPTNTSATFEPGTVTTVPGPTTPAVVSSASNKPEPRGWTTNGTGQLTCTVMLVAVIMCLL